ncbi:MAG TPA: hypothetical protein VFZ37_21420 [Jiangellaceae bacterium]
MTNDDQLLAELREAFNAAEQVPADFIAAGKAAFAWRTIDAELAALADEVRGDAAPAGTRTEHAAVRALSFRADGLSIELEVTGDAILGQIVPPRAGQVEVQSLSGTEHEAAVDESGWFAIRPLPSRMFRLHLRTSTGDVVTEWITL